MTTAKNTGSIKIVIILLALLAIVLAPVILFRKPYKKLDAFPGYYEGSQHKLYFYDGQSIISEYRLVKNVNVSDIKVLSCNPHCIYGTDKYVIFGSKVYEGFNTSRVKFLNWLDQYLMDDNNVYYVFSSSDAQTSIRKIPNSDPSTFEVAIGEFYKDKNGVYYKGVLIPNVDSQTLEYRKQADGSMVPYDKNGEIQLPVESDIDKLPAMPTL